MKIHIEQTPNPSTLKFVLDQPIAASTLEIKEVAETFQSPLAHKLFGFPWMESVFIGLNFVSVTKQDWVEWEVLAQPLADLILNHFEHGEVAMVEPTDLNSTGESEADILNTDSDIVKNIKKILNTEIRPVVALDGGDIHFRHFDASTGILSLNMRGACSGCPSSAATLKEGIEVRIREAIPEVREVVAD